MIKTSKNRIFDPMPNISEQQNKNSKSSNVSMHSSTIKNSFSSTIDQLKYKVILVGDSSVGKSALFLKFIHGDKFSPSQTNITTIDFNTKDVFISEEKQSVKLFIWDTAGQERYRCIVSTYFKGCHGVLLIFDLSEPKTFQNLKNEWFPTLKKKAETATILLVGNKCDLEQKVDQQQVMKFARQNNLSYIKSSVKSDINVKDSFERLTKMVNAKRHLMERPQSFRIKKKGDGKHKRSCCLKN